MDENFCNSMAHDVDKMRLKEVYLHQNQVDDEVFDIFHIYELSTETTGLPVKPAITTNCAVSEVFNRALQIMHDNDGDSGDMGNGMHIPITFIKRIYCDKHISGDFQDTIPRAILVGTMQIDRRQTLLVQQSRQNA